MVDENAGAEYVVPLMSIGDPASYGLGVRVPPFATSGEPGDFFGVPYGTGAGHPTEPDVGDEVLLEIRFFDSDGFVSISCVYRQDEDTYYSNGFNVL